MGPLFPGSWMGASEKGTGSSSGPTETGIRASMWTMIDMAQGNRSGQMDQSSVVILSEILDMGKENTFGKMER